MLRWIRGKGKKLLPWEEHFDMQTLELAILVAVFFKHYMQTHCFFPSFELTTVVLS